MFILSCFYKYYCIKILKSFIFVVNKPIFFTMKKILLLLFALSFILFYSCKKNDDNNDQGNNNNPPRSGVLIKGKINSKDGLADARNVLVFKGPRADMAALSYDIISIQNGIFSDTVKIGQCIALVFLDSAYRYIGTLWSHGIDLFPLGKLSKGDTTTIDLSTLTLTGDIVTPTHDPFGHEIIISNEEFEVLKQIGGFFKSLAKNLDTDNDGNLDILSNHELYIKSNFELHVGRWWGTDSLAADIFDSVENKMNYWVVISSGTAFIYPDTLVLSGPQGNPYSDIRTGQWDHQLGGGFHGGFYRKHTTDASYWPGDFGPFEQGVYTLSINGVPGWTVDFSNIDAKCNLMIVVPTLHTNTEGKLVSFSLEYRLPDGSPVSNPENIIIQLGVQLEDITAHQIWWSPWLSPFPLPDGSFYSIYSYTLPSPIDISTLFKVRIGYTDMLGNEYSFTYFNS